MIKTSSGWIIAAYYWSPYLSFAVLEGERIVELSCHRLSGGRQSRVTVDEHFQKLVRDYAPDRIVIPPVAALLEANRLTECPVETISMTTAKELLVNSKQRATHRDLIIELDKRCPQLKRYIPKLTVPRSDVAAVRSRRAVQLFPVALGLAATSSIPRGELFSKKIQTYS